MKICYFGTYDRKRPRNRIIIKGLRKNGVTVIECHYSPWGDIEDKSQIRSVWAKINIALKFIGGYCALIVRYLRVEDHDAVIVGYMGHFDMIIAKPLAMLRRKPVYFNVFLSLYDTMIFDRQLAKPRGIVAALLYNMDKISCWLADKIFLDTQAHIDYFVTTFKIPRQKFVRVFIGTDEDLFYPSSSTESAKLSPATFIVLFYGQFIPLHGSEYIIEAAHLLRQESDIAFTFMGAGQEYEAMHRRANDLKLTNITWAGWVPHEKIRTCVHGADICLGIFGKTAKASRVIPNKAFEIIAAKKPLLTGDSQAARELFTEKNDVLFCKMADPKSLAASILLLKDDASMRSSIAARGYGTFQRRCSTALIGREVMQAIGA